MRIIPILLSGGSGTRLWPLSRSQRAKQYAPLAGAESTFAQTVRRVADPALFEKPIVLTGAEARFLVADQAREAGVDVDIVLEPEGRDSLAAIAAAAVAAGRRRPDAVAVALSCDQVIDDATAFATAVAAAGRVAEAGRICVVGVEPTGPATKYGYVRPGDFDGEVAPLVAFEEKPDAARAEALIAEGCLWNAGMFAFRADVARDEVAAHAPDVVRAVEAAFDEATNDLGALRLGPSFAAAPRTSFDYGVMEKTARGAVVRAGFSWVDIGDWAELWAVADKSPEGLASEGDVIATDVRDSYIRGDQRLICALGVEGLAIVDTADALLVAPLDRAQEVKELVTGLRAAGRREADEPARVYRPWGWYQTIDQGTRFRVKRIQVAPGKQLSLQKHHHRSEHWTVVCGAAEVTIGNETRMVNENESVYVPVGEVHRLANPGKIGVELIEVQTGAYLEEDDIIRIDDDFGRC